MEYMHSFGTRCPDACVCMVKEYSCTIFCFKIWRALRKASKTRCFAWHSACKVDCMMNPSTHAEQIKAHAAKPKPQSHEETRHDSLTFVPALFLGQGTQTTHQEHAISHTPNHAPDVQKVIYVCQVPQAVEAQVHALVPFLALIYTYFEPLQGILHGTIDEGH
eukprot:533772-Pelagomonas_calceolata.AAC.6